MVDIPVSAASSYSHLHLIASHVPYHSGHKRSDDRSRSRCTGRRSRAATAQRGVQSYNALLILHFATTEPCAPAASFLTRIFATGAGGVYGTPSGETFPLGRRNFILVRMEPKLTSCTVGRRRYKRRTHLQCSLHYVR